MAEVLDRLRARLQGFNSTGDITGLLGNEVLREIQALGMGRGNQHDMSAIEIVAWLYWYRSQALPGDAAVAERESATKLFELLYISDPEAVPGALQPVLKERRAAKQERIFANSPFTQPSINVQETMRQSAELFQRYHLTGDAGMLDDSIGGFRRLLTALPPSHVLRPLVEVTLGLALQSLWERATHPDVLAEAIAQLRSGLGRLPSTHEIRPMAMAALAALLAAQYTEHEDAALLTEASALIEEAAAKVPPDSPMYPNIQSARNMISAIHPASRVDPGGLDGAIAAARRRLEQTPPGHPDRPTRVMELGAALAARFEVTRVGDTLEESAELLREAIATAPAGFVHLPALRGMLGTTLSELARQRSDLALSEEAIGLIREALAAVGTNTPLSAAFHGNLATALWQRYSATEDPDLLTEAIREGRQAVKLVTADSPIRTPLMQNLAGALHDLHRRTGDLALLDESIDLARRAERTAARDSSAHRGAMNSLAVGLILRYRRTGDPASAQDAVSWARRALGEVPDDHPDRITHVVTLAQALAETSGAAADVQEAIDLLRQTAHAVALRPRKADDLPYVANALAAVLLQRASDLPAVEEAIGWLRRAAADHAAGPGTERCLGLLGKALQRRYELTQDRGALSEALTCFAAAVPADGSPTMRVLRDAEVGRTAARLWDWPRALQGFEAAIEGLPQMADIYLARGDQEFQLSILSGLAADSAACALTAGQPERAVELLEQGRGVLLARALDTRRDLDLLRDRDPASAARLTALRDQLDALSRPSADRASAGGDPGDVSRRAELRRKLAAEWDELVARVRDQGSDDFLRPPAFARLAEAADQGPIVLFNVSGYRSDAILLTADGLDVVQLEKSGRLTAEVTERASRFQEAVGRLAAQGNEEPDSTAQACVTDTLGWLWDKVAEPVLGRLRLLDGPSGPDGGRPRVWWCAGGPLALLPLHAAGRDGTAVIDKVVSSYVPTVRSLLHARSGEARLDPAGGMLVVAMSTTPGQPGLRNASAEGSWLKNTFRAETLFNERATADRVIDALPRFAIAHFACHCVADLTSPSASGLLCHDHQDNPLSVARISRLDLSHAALAYLSACSTSRTPAALADEAVHITSAFQIAGYAQVIGTLWEADDETSTTVATGVYERLHQNRLSGRSAAYALHDAVSAVRRDGAGEVKWAPYVHVGA